MLDGDRLALARLITRVENRSPEVPEIMRAVHERTGRAYVLGITGPPGAGKSTLVDRITSRLRAESLPVGVIAVDPSSPFTGGAVLGETHTLDPDVFIRSMATRGSLGGLARATGDVIKLMDAFGFPWIIIETVGVGQTELDIARQADTTVVALVPESGDSVQAMKAGLMEVADVFVVNKADRDGAHALMAELRFSVHLHYTSGAQPKDLDWEVPVLAVQAANDVGIDADGPDPPAPGRARAGGRPGRATAGAAARGARGPAGGGVHHPAHRARADRSRALRHHRGGDRGTPRPLLGGEPDPGRGAQAVLTARALDTPDLAPHTIDPMRRH
jgi:LAO/AO transport system kinase